MVEEATRKQVVEVEGGVEAGATDAPASTSAEGTTPPLSPASGAGGEGGGVVGSEWGWEERGSCVYVCVYTANLDTVSFFFWLR